MEMIGRQKSSGSRCVPGSGRVHRARGAEGVLRVRRQGGFTLVEVVMTMVLLSVGLLSLAPVMLAVAQGNRFAQNITLATTLAEDRLEQILNQPVYAGITLATFPSEAQGQIRGGDPQFARFARSVAIVDSLDVLGRSLLKSVTVTVTWTRLTGQTSQVTLHGRVSRF
jgi:prepilin-type N-terminal cleavage/methylation domain-containing protein